MSRRFRICMAKGGGEFLKMSYGRPLKVEPYFKREKNTLGGAPQSWSATILTLEQNPPERKFLTYVKVAEDS